MAAKYKTHHLHLIDLETIVTIFKLDKLGKFRRWSHKDQAFFTMVTYFCHTLPPFLSSFPPLARSIFPCNPSHLRFHTQPNYRIQQANWGCLKQVSLVSSGNYGSCCKQPFGHGKHFQCLDTHTTRGRDVLKHRACVISPCLSDSEVESLFDNRGILCLAALMIAIFVYWISQIHLSHRLWWHI